jgi:putative hemolysin
MASSGLEPQNTIPRSPFGLRELFGSKNSLGKFLPLGQIESLYSRAREVSNSCLLEGVLAEMRVDSYVDDAELARIPSTGPVLVVSNHPFGILNGTVLGAVMRRVRPDVKILTSVLLKSIEGLDKHCIYVDSRGRKGAIAGNAGALLECVRWLRLGGLLVLFPAAELAQPESSQLRVDVWNPAVARLVRETGAVTLPVYFQDKNSAASQALNLVHPGIVHPDLRSALLLNEFLAQKGRSVHLHIGRVIPANAVTSRECDIDATRYLYWRTHLLAQRGSEKSKMPAVLRPLLPKKRMDRLTRPMAREALLSDVENLRPDQVLDDSPEFTVFSAREHEIPHMLPELGRLREVTFRDVGEGTGRSTDLDTFDRYYTHILLWNKLKQELVGAYRIGKTEDILPLRGMDGLYTSTLFRFEKSFFTTLGPALELGRSFVRPEYQRQYAPLLLLWKGIARYVAAHPETPVLFGAVSMSGRYTRASRELLIRFFESRNFGDELTPLAQPRRPFRPSRIRSWDCRSIGHAMRELDELSDPIADMETDGKGIPVLIKHYSRLGGRLLGFNVDPKFSHVLDGLVVMDLRQTPPSSLERYMGKSGLASFRRYHGLPALQKQY